MKQKEKRKSLIEKIFRFFIAPVYTDPNKFALVKKLELAKRIESVVEHLIELHKSAEKDLKGIKEVFASLTSSTTDNDLSTSIDSIIKIHNLYKEKNDEITRILDTIYNIEVVFHHPWDNDIKERKSDLDKILEMYNIKEEEWNHGK